MSTKNIKQRELLERIIALEAELRELAGSSDSARHLLETSRQGLLVLQDEKVVFVNQAMARITGTTVGELLDHSPDEVLKRVHEADREQVRKTMIRRLAEGTGPDTYYIRVIRPDGEIRWVETYGTRVTFNDRPALQGVFMDVTEHHEAEEALRLSEARLRSITESARDSIFSKDTRRRYTFVNPAMCRVLNSRPEELLGRTPEEVFPAPEAAMVREVDEASLAGKDVDTVRTLRIGDRLLTFHTIQVPMRDKDGRVIGVTGVVRDVTQQMAAEEALKESRAQYQQLIEESPIAILVHVAGRIAMANPEMVRLARVTSETELVGKPMWQYIHEDYHDVVRRRMTEVGKTPGLHTTPLEMRLVQPDGEPLWVEAIGGATMHEGEPASQVIFRNIDAQKRAEKDKRKLEEQLVQSQKLEAVGQLAGGVAHDFNNLLTEITGNAALALMELTPGHPVRDYFVAINDAASRATRLTRQLLTFSSKQVIQPTLVHPNTLVQDLEEMLRRLIGADVEMAVDLAPGTGYVQVDPGQFEQVLINLCLNARDAMPDGGRLAIETENAFLDSDYCRDHSLARPGRYVRVSVSDTGIGMNEEVMARIYEPFYTTKPKNKGTGLGLSTSYGIIRQHKGFIEVYSEPGQGTTFKVYFPRAQPPRSTSPGRPAPGSLPTGTETILYVEDEPVVREVSATILARLGYRVLEASTPSSALQIVATHKEPIDLLLTDVVLPEMNGRDLARRVTQSRRGIKVLYTSGYTENIIAHKGVLDSGVEFIGKPFSPSGLARKIRAVLDGTPDEP